MVATDERACPVCAETIKKTDDVCSHCGHRFRGRDPSSKPQTASASGRKLHPGERPPNWNGVADKPSNKILRNTLIGIGAVVWAGIVGLAMVSNSKSDGERNEVAASESLDGSNAEQDAGPTDEELAQLIAKDAISTYAEKDRKLYPKLFATLGDRVFEVEDLGKRAALLSLKTGECDKVVYVDVSEASTRQELQFFVDCEDETRVRVTETEIRNGIATDIETKAQRDEKIIARNLQHQKLISDAKAQVTQALRDPVSAEFGPIVISEKEGTVACGTVNARNGFGGMSGQQPFVAFRDAITTPADSGFYEVWEKYCGM